MLYTLDVTLDTQTSFLLEDFMMIVQIFLKKSG